MAEAVLNIDEQYGDAVEGDIIDCASFANIGLGSESGKGGRADIMNSLGCRWQPSEKGEGSRIAGKSLVHESLALVLVRLDLCPFTHFQTFPRNLEPDITHYLSVSEQLERST